MKKLVIFLAASILISSCRNIIGHDGLDYTEPSSGVSSCIEEAFYYYIDQENDSDTACFYSIDFLIEVPGFPLNDTLIGIYRMNDNSPMDGFKGVTNIGNYKILIFDKNDVGGDFYISDSLRKLSLNNLSFTSFDSLIYCCSFILNGSHNLELIGCQPDNFTPIKIR